MTPLTKQYIEKLKEYQGFLKKVYLLHNKPDSVIELFEDELALLEQEEKTVSDEEIMDFLNLKYTPAITGDIDCPHTGGVSLNKTHRQGFFEGAKWMRDKLLNNQDNDNN